MLTLPDGVYVDSQWGLHYKEGATIMDNFPEDLTPVVNADHWSQYPPQHPMIVDFFGIFFLMLTVICLSTNFLIIFVFLAKSELRTPANMLMVNLAVSDSGIFITQGPLMFINAFMDDFWMFGPEVCKAYGFLGACFGTCSIVTLTFIAYDRYNVILYGIGGPKMTPTKSFLSILFIWTYTVAVCVPPYFGWGGYKLEGLFITCSYEYVSEDINPKSFLLFAFIVNYCIPMSFIIYFYYHIVKAIFFQEAAMKRAQAKLITTSKQLQNHDNWAIEVKLAKLALNNVLVWVLAWTPYAVVCLIGAFGNRVLVTPLVSQLPSFFAKFASAFNPLTTTLAHPKVRNAIAEMFPSLGLTKYDIEDIEEEIFSTPSSRKSSTNPLITTTAPAS